MRLIEFYPEKQGRPDSEVSLDMDKRGPSIPLNYISGVMLKSSYGVQNITNNYTTSNRTLILCDACAGPMTITLPTASANSGRYYIIKKVDSSLNVVTIEPASGELVDGEVSIKLTLQYQYVVVSCSGVLAGDSYWHVIGGSNVKMEELISDIGEEQTSLLYQLLDELRQSKLHLASLSNEPIESGDGE